MRSFAVFCRLALALGFIPSGIIKVMGERFTALPPHHPLGHYFDALHQTGFYYRFIGVGQLMAALLLLVPRTALLGAILYLPIISNICVLAYATRFEGTFGPLFFLSPSLLPRTIPQRPWARSPGANACGPSRRVSAAGAGPRPVQAEILKSPALFYR